MTTWQNATPEQRSAAIAAANKVYNEDFKDVLSGQGPSVEGEFVFNLSAGQDDLKEHLSLSAKIPISEKAKLDDIKQALQNACSEITDVKVSVSAGYKLGDVVKGIEKVTDFDGKKTTYDPAGKVVLLDFWATWCPPCQGPMAHNQKMLEQNTDWANEVDIVGLSIDQSLDTMKNHVNAKGWTKVTHVHVRNGECTADQEFGVRGVPHCLLLDKNGKIVFIGHPMTRKLEEDINALRRGEEISGEGTAKAAAAADGESEGGSISSATYAEAKEFFLSTTKGVMDKQEVKDAAKGMARAFLVMTSEGKWDAAKNDIGYSCQFYSVLVGPDASIKTIDTESASIQEKKDWFKMNIRHQKV